MAEINIFFSCFQFGQTMTNLANAKYRYLIQQLHLVKNGVRNTHFILHQKEKKIYIYNYINLVNKPLLAAVVSEDNAQG